MCVYMCKRLEDRTLRLPDTLRYRIPGHSDTKPWDTPIQNPGTLRYKTLGHSDTKHWDTLIQNPESPWYTLVQNPETLWDKTLLDPDKFWDLICIFRIFSGQTLARLPGFLRVVAMRMCQSLSPYSRSCIAIVSLLYRCCTAITFRLGKLLKFWCNFLSQVKSKGSFVKYE